MDTFSGTGIENQFEGYLGGDLADEDSIRNMEENDYLNEWKLFLTEGNKEVANALIVLKGKPQVDVYISSLENDIRLNGPEDYQGYTSDDWEEDYANYMADKMDY